MYPHQLSAMDRLVSKFCDEFRTEIFFVRISVHTCQILYTSRPCRNSGPCVVRTVYYKITSSSDAIHYFAITGRISAPRFATM